MCTAKCFQKLVFKDVVGDKVASQVIARKLSYILSYVNNLEIRKCGKAVEAYISISRDVIQPLALQEC